MMDFDEFGNVVEEEDASVHQENEDDDSVEYVNDTITQSVLTMNDFHARVDDEKPSSIFVRGLTETEESKVITISERNLHTYTTCCAGMLHSRDQVCRFVDDTLGFGLLKESGDHSGGYNVPEDLITNLLKFLEEDHLVVQKKNHPKMRKRRKPIPAEDVSADSIFLDLGPICNNYRFYWTTLRTLMEWKYQQYRGWLTSKCVDFLSEMVNLSLGHAPNDNLYPTGLMADTMTGFGLVPQGRDRDRHPVLSSNFTQEFEYNFKQCIRKVWFPKAKTHVKKALFCYQSVSLPLPRIAFEINTAGMHWETLSVDPNYKHVWSLDPFHDYNDHYSSSTNFYRRWAAKYFGMYDSITNGQNSPYAGHKDMICYWIPKQIHIKRAILQQYNGEPASTFSHSDVDYKTRTDLPKQKDGKNCGLYSWHFCYSYLFGCKADKKFDPKHMRRRIVFLYIILRSYFNRDGGRDGFELPTDRKKKCATRSTVDGIPEVLPWFIDHVQRQGFTTLADQLSQLTVSSKPLIFLYDPNHYNAGPNYLIANPTLDRDVFPQMETNEPSLNEIFSAIKSDADFSFNEKEQLKVKFDPSYIPQEQPVVPLAQQPERLPADQVVSDEEDDKKISANVPVFPGTDIPLSDAEGSVASQGSLRRSSRPRRKRKLLVPESVAAPEEQKSPGRKRKAVSKLLSPVAERKLPTKRNRKESGHQSKADADVDASAENLSQRSEHSEDGNEGDNQQDDSAGNNEHQDGNHTGDDDGNEDGGSNGDGDGNGDEDPGKSGNEDTETDKEEEPEEEEVDIELGNFLSVVPMESTEYYYTLIDVKRKARESTIRKKLASYKKKYEWKKYQYTKQPKLKATVIEINRQLDRVQHVFLNKERRKVYDKRGEEGVMAFDEEIAKDKVSKKKLAQKASTEAQPKGKVVPIAHETKELAPDKPSDLEISIPAEPKAVVSNPINVEETSLCAADGDQEGGEAKGTMPVAPAEPTVDQDPSLGAAEASEAEGTATSPAPAQLMSDTDSSTGKAQRDQQGGEAEGTATSPAPAQPMADKDSSTGKAQGDQQGGEAEGTSRPPTPAELMADQDPSLEVQQAPIPKITLSPGIGMESFAIYGPVVDSLGIVITQDQARDMLTATATALIETQTTALSQTQDTDKPEEKLTLASDALGLSAATGVAAAGTSGDDEMRDDSAELQSSGKRPIIKKQRKARVKKGKKVWPRKKTRADDSSADSSDNQDDKDMIKYEKDHRKYIPEEDFMEDTFALYEDSIVEVDQSWCNAQKEAMNDPGRRRKTTVTPFSELIDPEYSERKIIQLGQRTDKLEVFFAWDLKNNKSLRIDLCAFMKSGFQTSDHAAIDKIAKHDWTWAIALQKKAEGERVSSPIALAFFAMIKYKGEYRATCLDYLLVSGKPASEYNINGIPHMRSQGIGRFLLRAVACLGFSMCPKNTFSMFLKAPHNLVDYYKTMGFLECDDWGDLADDCENVETRANIIENDEREVQCMLLHSGKFIPRVYVPFHDYRGISFRIPQRLPRGEATYQCLSVIQDKHYRAELKAHCPSAKYTMRVPIGKIINCAHRKFRHRWPLQTETWKLEMLEVSFEQKKRKVNRNRRFRRILFDEGVNVKICCSECRKTLGQFPTYKFLDWRNITQYILRDFFHLHFDPTNPYRCVLLSLRQSLQIKTCIANDYGSRGAGDEATIAKIDHKRYVRLLSSKTQTEVFIAEVFSSLHNIAMMWCEWVYPKRRKDGSTIRSRNQVSQNIKFQGMSLTLSDGRSLGERKGTASFKKHRDDAAAEWDDLEFQASLKKIGYIRPLACRRGPPHKKLVNAKVVKDALTYWVGIGKDTRALSPDFVEKNFPEKLRENCLASQNKLFQISKQVQTDLRAKFKKLSSSQVTFIQVKYDNEKRRTIFYNVTKSRGDDGVETILTHDELDIDWLIENFAHSEPVFLEELLRAKSGVIKAVPQGAAFHEGEEAPEEVIGAPVVKFEQNGQPSCVVCSLASALHASGDIFYSELVYSWLNDSLTITTGKRTDGKMCVYRDRMDFIAEKSRRTPRVYKVKVRGSQGFGFYTSPFSADVHLCEVVGMDNARDHVVGLWNGWIFDSNLNYALPYSKESLDWCSGGGEYKCEFKHFGKTLIFERTNELDYLQTKKEPWWWSKVSKNP